MYHPDICHFQGGNSRATLLRILPQDHFWGLVHFEDLGETRWMNFAQMCVLGSWRPVRK